MPKWVWWLIIGLMLLGVGIWFVKRRQAKGQTLAPKAAEPFTIPKGQRIETTIATLEQLLEETEDKIIHEALQTRLMQLKAEREKLRKEKGA